MAQVRTFVAIECSDRLRLACAKAIAHLTPAVDEVRWVRPDNIHLTLKFLGEVEDRELHAVCTKVEAGLENMKSFSLPCRGVGAFPSVEKPNTIWVDVVDEKEKLVRLHSQLANSLEQLGFPIERRPYRPHITLGRTRSRRVTRPAEWQAAVEHFADHEFGLVEVNNVVVFSSELERQGPTYTALARYQLPT